MQPLERDSYQIMGYIKLNAPVIYDFSQTLRLLYADDVNVVLARLTRNSQGALVFTVLEAFAGDLENGEVHPLLLPAHEIVAGNNPNGYTQDVPEDAASILMFLRKEDAGYRPLLDAESWLVVDADTITTASGSIIPLSQARYDIIKIRDEISLPAEFLYLEEMETLVQKSNYVFIGSFQGVRDIEQRRFDIFSPTMRQSVSGESQIYTLNIKHVLKGDLASNAEEMLVCDAPDVMLQNTIYYKSGQSVAYSKSDAPPVMMDGIDFLFFIIDPPLNMQSAPKYFVNSIQGYVPILGDMTAQLNTNSVFFDAMYLDEVIGVINGVVQGNADAYEYDPRKPNADSKSQSDGYTDAFESGPIAQSESLGTDSDTPTGVFEYDPATQTGSFIPETETYIPEFEITYERQAQ